VDVGRRRSLEAGGHDDHKSQTTPSIRWT
jgi:hypothetical protein